jgi:palmitoyltransferase
MIVAEPLRPTSYDSRDVVAGPRYSNLSEPFPADPEAQHTTSGTTTAVEPEHPESPKEKTSPTAEHTLPSRTEDRNVGVLDSLHSTAPDNLVNNGSAANPNGGPGPMESHPENFNGQPLIFTRRPPTTPVLHPAHRWCSKCEIIKPYRAHHCRACGTCVLKYDHHCPWIGQCCGARNHKVSMHFDAKVVEILTFTSFQFFLNFCQWACIFCIWTFATLLAQNVKFVSNPNFDMDPQQIVIIALCVLSLRSSPNDTESRWMNRAGVFMIFTLLLCASHILLILRNQSTVESLGTRSIREREQYTLSQMYPMWKVR